MNLCTTSLHRAPVHAASGSFDPGEPVRLKHLVPAVAAAVALTFTPVAHAAPSMTPAQWVDFGHMIDLNNFYAAVNLRLWYEHVLAQRNRDSWERTAMCEQGGDWTANGPLYTGGLGFLHATWHQYGGLEFAPNAGAATEDEQIIVANRVADANHFDVTRHDLNGRCTGW